MTHMFAPLLLAAFLLAIQGVLLRVACAVCAYEDPPPYASALWTAMAAAVLAVLATAAWGCTFGVLASWLFGATVSTVLSVVMGMGVTAEVYRRRLGTGSGHALLIALVHHGMAWGIHAVLWGLLGWLR